MRLLNLILNYLFSDLICQFAEWYDKELARERMEPKRARRAMQKEVYR